MFISPKSYLMFVLQKDQTRGQASRRSRTLVGDFRSTSIQPFGDIAYVGGDIVPPCLASNIENSYHDQIPSLSNLYIQFPSFLASLLD